MGAAKVVTSHWVSQQPNPGRVGVSLGRIYQGLKEGGFIPGQNAIVEYRWAEGRRDQLPNLAAELVQRHVAVLVSTGGAEPARAAKDATATIPVVFVIGPDPVQLGLVESLARPGRNISGFTLFTGRLGPKRLELASKLVPGAAAIAVMENPENANLADHLRDLQDAANVFRRKLHVELVNDVEQFDAAFSHLVAAEAGMLLVGSDTYFHSHRVRLAALASKVQATGYIRNPRVRGSRGSDLIRCKFQRGISTSRSLYFPNSQG